MQRRNKLEVGRSIPTGMEVAVDQEEGGPGRGAASVEPGLNTAFAHSRKRDGRGGVEFEDGRCVDDQSASSAHLVIIESDGAAGKTGEG